MADRPEYPPINPRAILPMQSQEPLTDVSMFDGYASDICECGLSCNWSCSPEAFTTGRLEGRFRNDCRHRVFSHYPLLTRSRNAPWLSDALDPATTDQPPDICLVPKGVGDALG
ncbi:hypothetical protein BREVUG8_110449 [Brevundimonas sp. G8]|nr:hypothetical protein BREVUG8_110449 [Brevundimonas sp. G8]